MRIFGKGFNFSQDGPGNRLVYHLSGCNMKCIWCSNADGMSATAGEERSAEDVFKECVSCKPMFFSGGGVTFTGGEATIQFAELLELLKLLKAEGISTALETNATCKGLPELAEYIDYLIMDFKHHDNDELVKYTGVGLANIKANFEHFCKSGRQLHVRIPLINNINTQFPEKFAEYFASQNTENVVFEFLAYHEYGKDKWETEYKVQNGFVDKATLQKFKDVFNAHGLKIITT